VIIAFLTQLSYFLGITVLGPIPDILSLLTELRLFSRQMGFALVVGGALGLVLSFKAEDLPKIGSAAWYVHLVTHELVHAGLARLCGYEIKEMKFTRHGGYVAYSKPQSRGNFLISLGPYLFPLVPIILTIVAALFRGTAQGIVVFFLGISLGWHVAETATEALDQYDVQQAGRFFSVVLILWVNLCLLALVMSVVAPGRASFLRFITDALELDVWYLSSALGMLSSGIRG
jgi:hypothetical protein